MRAAAYMFKVMKLQIYPSLKQELDLNYPTHSYGIRTSNIPRLPFPRVAALRISFMYQFPDIWSNVPDYIKNLNTVKTFKNELKSYILQKY